MVASRIDSNGVKTVDEETDSFTDILNHEDEMKSAHSISKTSALPYLITAISTLVTGLSIAILAMWLLSEENAIFGGPPATLLAWQDDYEEMTGIDKVNGNLDGSGVTICIVDSGVDLSHPGMDGVTINGWYDAVNGKIDPYDDQGHGTAMTGIIASKGGVGGIAKGSELLIAKGIDGSGSGTDEGIAEAVDWCSVQGADIISLSLGGDQGPGLSGITLDVLENSVEDALDEGVFVVAAAGNDGTDDDGDVASPGSVEDVICVGGVNRNGDVWSGSSEGDNNGRLWPNPILPRQDPDKKPEVIAPASEVPVLLTNSGGWYGYSSGTSAATAWVSGILALVVQNEPDLARSGDRSAIEDIKNRISQTSTQKEGVTGHDDRFGYGIVNTVGLIGDISNESTSNQDFERLVYAQQPMSTTNVAPDNSTKADLNPRFWDSVMAEIQELKASTRF
ncbi:MAG: S8 family peptidase [Candidatus Thalassarchaeaceae archaeon]